MTKKAASKSGKINKTKAKHIKGGSTKRSYGEAVKKPTIKPPSFNTRPKD